MSKGDHVPTDVKNYEVNRLFQVVVKNEASDLHLKVGSPPMIRMDGIVRPLDMKELSAKDIEKLMFPTLTDRQRENLEEEGGADYAHVLPDGQRFRVNLYRQRGVISMAARRVNAVVPNFEELNLPLALARVAEYHQGMVILAGPTGSGKSTTIAAMLDHINKRRRCHILTIEDPIEFMFTDDKAFINQRELGIDVPTWAIALKHAMREDPDVILIGEMRDQVTFDAGMQAAETGHLVFGTLHSASAPSTVGRILDLFPPDQQEGIRQTLAFNLRAIICQMLVPSMLEGVQRVPASEIMLNNATVRNLIRTKDDAKLADAIRIGSQEGMRDFTESLRLLVDAEMVEPAVAMEFAPSPEALKMALKGIRVAEQAIL